MYFAFSSDLCRADRRSHRLDYADLDRNIRDGFHEWNLLIHVKVLCTSECLMSIHCEYT